MRVFVIRHGESETNRLGQWTGWIDAPLTDKGREDAGRAGALLSYVSFSRIFTSDLSRAVETARIAIPGCDYEASPLLREVNVGSIAGKPYAVITDEERARAASVGYADFGGESIEEFYSRIGEVKTMLEGLGCERVALFSHAGFLKGMLNTVLGTKLSRSTIACSNCTVAIFEYENSRWRLHSWINLF